MQRGAVNQEAIKNIKRRAVQTSAVRNSVMSILKSHWAMKSTQLRSLSYHNNSEPAASSCSGTAVHGWALALSR
jgi:hypothetical protein